MMFGNVKHQLCAVYSGARIGTYLLNFERTSETLRALENVRTIYYYFSFGCRLHSFLCLFLFPSNRERWERIKINIFKNVRFRLFLLSADSCRSWTYRLSLESTLDNNRTNPTSETKSWPYDFYFSHFFGQKNWKKETIKKFRFCRLWLRLWDEWMSRQKLWLTRFTSLIFFSNSFSSRMEHDIQLRIAAVVIGYWAERLVTCSVFTSDCEIKKTYRLAVAENTFCARLW